MANPSSNDALYEAFVLEFSRAEPGLRAFVRSLVPTWEDADEVVQNTSLVLWKKFPEFEPGTEFGRWAAVIARFEVLKYRRTRARDRHVFSEDLVEILADEFDEESETLQRERNALETCLRKLPDHQRRLVKSAYAPGRTIREVAEELGKSATAFYKTLNRIRQTLLDCIERTLKEEGHAV